MGAQSNMLTILFFARLKEQLGTETVSIPLAKPVTVAELKGLLISHNNDWRIPLSAGNLLCAINHEIVGPEQLVIESDEVAFFPPVTGG